MSGAGYGIRRRDHNSSEAIAAILHPHEGYREKLQRRGITPRDYIRENKLQVKRLQARNREQRALEAAPRPEPFKLSRFKTVRPRTTNQEPKHPPDHENEEAADGEDAKPKRERRHSEPDSPDVRRLQRRLERVHIKEPVPTLRELEERDNALSKLKKDKVDYVNANAWEVIKKSPPKDMGPEQRRVRNANFGRIPKYLLERKEQWAREEDERRRTAPDPDCPKGMVLLDEDERVRTLHVLCQSLEEARLRMNRLPLHVETLSQVRRKAELEDKLREIEDAIRVFDRPKVYVTKPADADGGAARGRRSNNSSRVSAAA